MRVPDVCRIDWMHVMDLGVSADFVGQLLIYVLSREPGANREVRMINLNKRLEAAYARTGSGKVIDRVTEGFLNLPNYGKLKAHPAEVRALIPVAVDTVRQAVTGASPVELSIQQAMHFLQEMYEGLSSDKPGHQERQASNCLRFVGLYVALDEVTDEFHIRPKVHLAQELMEMSPGSRAVHHWTYRDEDFGGTAVTLFRPWGGVQDRADSWLDCAP